MHSPDDFKTVGGYDKDNVAGGPHKLHGVYRGRILEDLLAALPKDLVRYGVHSNKITLTETGDLP